MHTNRPGEGMHSIECPSSIRLQKTKIYAYEKIFKFQEANALEGVIIRPKGKNQTSHYEQ